MDLQRGMASYLVAVADRGMTSEVKPFASFAETEKAFAEIARSHGYEPEEIKRVRLLRRFDMEMD